MTTIPKNSFPKDFNSCMYDRIIDLLYEIKLVRGATFLNATLRRHKKISAFLTKMQIQYIEDLDSCIDDKGSLIVDEFKSLQY